MAAGWGAQARAGRGGARGEGGVWGGGLGWSGRAERARRAGEPHSLVRQKKTAARLWARRRARPRGRVESPRREGSRRKSDVWSVVLSFGCHLLSGVGTWAVPPQAHSPPREPEARTPDCDSARLGRLGHGEVGEERASLPRPPICLRSPSPVLPHSASNPSAQPRSLLSPSVACRRRSPCAPPGRDRAAPPLPHPPTYHSSQRACRQPPVPLPPPPEPVDMSRL